MRSIKFRAWDTKNKKMIYNVGICSQASQPIIYNADDDTYNDIIGIPMQYIGITDKNGRDVYEGDIYRSPYHKDGVYYKVEYDIDYCCYQLKYRQHIYKNIDMVEEYDYVGNCYENPEIEVK
ncbi:MAG: YopX family protein [Saprospiraceae bacterium]